MLRLLILKRLYQFNSKVVTPPYSIEPTKQTCSVCSHNFSLTPRNDTHCVQNKVSVRFQSTSVHTAIQNSAKIKKKKARRLKKKYAELVEVTDTSSNQTKASVSKLKPKHLSLLIKQPDINLGQLYNLKNMKVQPVVSLKNSASHQKQESMPVVVSESISDEKTYSLTELNCGSYGEISEMENLDVSNCKDELLYSFDRSMDDVELKSKPMDDLDAAVLEHNYLLGDLAYHSQEMEELDDPVDETVLAEVQYDEPAVETMVVPVPEEAQSKTMKKFKGSAANKTHSKHSIRDQMAKMKQSDLEKAAKEECLFRNLYAYLEACVSCGLLNRALFSLLFYHSRSKHSKYTSPANETKLFNILLHGFARKGNLNKVREIHQILQKDKIPLSAQSYAAFFECVGRLPADNASSYQVLSEFVKEMTHKGLTFKDIIQKSVFVSDQREVVVDVIRRIEPNFEPYNISPDICYSCNLLHELNNQNENGKGKAYKSPAEGLLTASELRQLVKEQLQIELNSYVQVKTIEKRSEPVDTILYYRKKLQEAQENWRKTISDAYHRDLRALRVQHHYRAFRHINLYPYLKVLDPEDYIEIILQEIRKLAEGSETFSPTTGQLYRELGSQVRARYEVKFKSNSGISKKVQHLYEEYCDWYLAPDSSSKQSMNTRQKWQHLEHENSKGPSLNMEEKSWPAAVLSGVGKFMYSIIMQDIKIDVNIAKSNSKTEHLVPAFYALFRNQGRLLKEEVKPHPVLARLFRCAAQEYLVFEVATVPMLCPPLPWSSITSGGYLTVKADLIRLPQQAAQQWHILKKTPVQQLYPSLDSLNQLGSVPWMVNESVLDVVIEVFNSGGSQRLDIPEPPSSCPVPSPLTPEMTKVERYQAYRQRMALRRRKAEMYSLWCDALYRLSLANHFRKRIFWLPHNMDFRGRVYPCPPHLNHLGSDMARSLLCFAKGEPLGPKGLNWLKIHLVNLTGLKKRDTVDERLRFAEEMLPEIMDSAEKPLTGCMWWAESEEPWQTLACCKEIARAMKSGDPENYVSHFPVHQDGSCNGLQHYAALGRDSAGAESVNLIPAVSPQDVYSCVAALVEKERMKDAERGLKIAQVLEGFVHRKVIKQTVMTTVYGVTRFGARHQIARQLKDIEGFPKDFVWQGSTYLVGKTFESLQEMFTSTKEIQDWFTECARLISHVCGQNVEWVTPLGLPVVQPYSRPNKKLEVHSSAKRIKEHYALDMFERPNVMKQRNAFPPNFIHSLDSSHMMLTSLFCEREGITFISVHDCFWTHPCTVDIMNKVCRDQFVALHSQPILEDLSKFLVKKYSYAESEFTNDGSVNDMTKRKLNKILWKLPSKGDFNLNSVLKSVYFFS
ncbi:DNA-directed RNA polymerase, mitochondrial isoform X2 [Zootermopsis nevadensis]|uniref:DNA-directed RNA polymerase, mitochondrial isoform X2 n=1 Tax=Zootermopsis nevadensis TaxID=136037 RepID=UPI000B8E4669|nr:DNA-directed RNA polymerase, mitochondrial isoform X2 [Zootermopsis nevadensis]